MNRKLSMEELRDICNNWAYQIGKKYKPDLIIFIAKSGFVIADEFSKFFRVPMEEVGASRTGGNLRRIIAPVFSYLPIGLRNKIVGAKIMYRFNGKKSERNIKVPDSLIHLSKTEKYCRILLIDDSIDTGWTFLHVYHQISMLFPQSEIRTLAFIQMKYAKERFQVHYHLYEDVLLLTPAQVDSSEYKLFLKQYKEWKDGKQSKNFY